MYRIWCTADVTKIRPHVGDLVEDDELYIQPGRRMPTLASALVVQARQRSGLTQLELAKRSGTSRSAISAIEHGRRDPSLERLRQILVAAGFDLLTQLAPHDDHDDVLKALGADMDPEVRRAHNTALREFLRRGAPGDGAQSSAPPPVSETSDRESVPEFPDVLALVEVLNRHGVRYVVIASSAAQFSVPRLITRDVDFTPATDRDNLARLSAALTELGARIRSHAEEQGFAFAHDGASLGRAKMWNLQCAYGTFDITFEPAAGGYNHLALRARAVTVRGVDIPVADLADVVASKRLANRPKDQLVLPELEQALAERNQARASAAPPSSFRDRAYPTPPGAGPATPPRRHPPEDLPPTRSHRR